MIHDTYMERYKKPSYKLPIIIFAMIVAISVFLSTQIQKTKENVNIAALNHPVSLDSIALHSNLSIQTSAAVETLETPLYAPPRIALDDVTRQVASPDEQSNNLAQNTSDEVSARPARSYAGSSLDDVFSKQQDKFLQTLARNAILEQQMQAVNTETTGSIPEKTKKSDMESVTQTSTPPPTVTLALESRATQRSNVINASLTIPPQNDARPLASNTAFSSQQAIAPVLSDTVNDSVVFVPSETELERFLSRFTYFYNSGDINSLMALFTDNASTNDSRGKNNIKADYVDLFNNTHARRLMIKHVKWQVDSNEATGDANFIVTVLNKNNRERSSIEGKLTITTVKQSQGYYISKLLHNLN